MARGTRSVHSALRGVDLTFANLFPPLLSRLYNTNKTRNMPVILIDASLNRS